jgi:hypothetical protein
MHLPETPKPARALNSEPVSKIEQLGGELDQENRHFLQTRQLTRRYAITAAMAAIVAPLAFPEGPR